MKPLSIGDVRISSIVERDGPWRAPNITAHDAAGIKAMSSLMAQALPACVTAIMVLHYTLSRKDDAVQQQLEIG